MDLKPETLNPKLIFAAVLALILLAIVPVSAQFSGNIDVSFKPVTDTVTIGDPITMTLRVVAPADETVSIPKLETAWGDFEVRTQSAPTVTANDDGTKTTEQTIIATLFDVGSFRTPKWEVSLTDMRGNATRRVVPQVSITVKSVLTDGDTELRDIKPQVDLPAPPPWLWVLALVLAGVLAFFGWKYLRRRLRAHRPADTFAAPEIDSRPPHEIALAELARIEALDLPGQGRFKEYYTLVGDCLRQYLESRYDISALERTTAELKSALRRTEISRPDAREFISLFEACDLVKFARFVPDMDAARKLIPAAETIITATAEPESAPEGESEKVSA